MVMEPENGAKYSWVNTKVILFGILILLRLVLSARLPSYILSDMPHDDGWLVRHALYILHGDWLGPYDQYTLIKGVFSPLLMAFSVGIGVTFSGLNTALYCLGCVVFIISVQPMIKNQWLQILLFALLLFNPLPYALETGQRIYRNGIGQWQILIVFGCLIAVFLRRNDQWKSLLKWVTLSGLTLGAFWQTREDGVWMYPFVLGVIIATVVPLLLQENKPKKKIAVCFLPLVIALFLSGLTSIVNYSTYGKLIVNDRSGGNYAKVAGDLYLITPNADENLLYKSRGYQDHYYNIYVSTMEKAFAASPTLESAAGPIRKAILGWMGGEDLKNGQLSTDHILFALRDGVRSAGYYRTLSETEEFYARVHKELQAAFEGGVLQRRGIPISPLIAPLQIEDLGKALSLMPMAVRNISEFNGVSSEAIPAKGSEIGIREFSLTAGGDYFTSARSIIGSGWAFAEDKDTQLVAGLYDRNGEIIASLSFDGGEDVFIGFKSKYQNAKKSRFSFKAEGYDQKSGVTMRFFDKNGKPLWEIPADGSTKCGGADGVFHYCIDNLVTDSSSEIFYARFVGRANSVIGVYQKLSPFIGMLSCLVYLFATILLIEDVRKKQALQTLSPWLILTGVGLTFILFVFCMCIVTATTFQSLIYLYSAPAYLLYLMFCGVSICWCWGVILEFRKRGY